MSSSKCDRCWGCGRLANTERQEPWSAWLELPFASNIAVISGLVRPMPCPACGGTGLSREEARADDVERHINPEIVLCVDCKDRGWEHRKIAQDGFEPMDCFVTCTTCHKLESPAQARAAHALVCGCDLPWMDIQEG